MKHLSFLFVLIALAGHPAAAQDNEAPDAPDAPGLFERGAQQFLEGLLKEMEPALQGMEEFIDQMGPALTELMREVEDWTNYMPPEVLPNGDIIIRRKPDVDPDPQVEEGTPQVDL